MKAHLPTPTLLECFIEDFNIVSTSNGKQTFNRFIIVFILIYNNLKKNKKKKKKNVSTEFIGQWQLSQLRRLRLRQYGMLFRLEE